MKLGGSSMEASLRKHVNSIGWATVALTAVAAAFIKLS